MKAEKLVEACTTVAEFRALLGAAIEEAGPREAWTMLRDVFDVNGSRAQRITLRTAMSEWPLTPLEDDDEALQLHCGLCGAPSGNTDTCVPCAVRSSKQERP